MFWIPPEAAAAIAAHQATISGTYDTAWLAWQEAMHQYQETTNSGGLPRLNFWIVVAVPKENFSDKLEWHAEVPMLMPVPGVGRLAGIATTKAELDQMIDKDDLHVHLTYKIKLQGQQAWRDLLEWLAKHDMLEKE